MTDNRNTIIGVGFLIIAVILFTNSTDTSVFIQEKLIASIVTGIFGLIALFSKPQKQEKDN